MKSNGIRLQKFLAERGVASRRQCEQYIVHRLVRVRIRNLALAGLKPGKWRDVAAIRSRS